VDIEHAVAATDLNKTSRPILQEVPSKRNGGAYRTGTDWLFCSNKITCVCAYLPMLELQKLKIPACLKKLLRTRPPAEAMAGYRPEDRGNILSNHS